MNKDKRDTYIMVMLSLGIGMIIGAALMGLGLFGCAPATADTTYGDTPVKASRITVVDGVKSSFTKFAVVEDSETGCQYLYIDGYESGAAVFLEGTCDQ